MTAAELLGYLGVALLVQVAAGAGLAVWRGRATRAAAPASAVTEEPAAAATGAWSGWRDFRVVRREFEDAAQTQCSFHLQPVDGVPLAPFRPGQYLTFALKVPAGAVGMPAEGRTVIRCYSLSDRPAAAGYRITVKRVLPPAGQPALPPGVSSGFLHDGVQAGDVLQVKAPAGHFVIDTDAAVPVVFIAGGIGITPLMSMLLWCVAEQPERPVHLFHGVRSSAEQAFKRVLEELAAAHPAFKLNVACSGPGADEGMGRDLQHAGHIDLALLRRTLPHGRHQFYVCGPPTMMHSLVLALREWEVQADDIHFEAFGPASARPTVALSNEPVVATSAGVDVRFSRSGRTLRWDGQDANLLDFAERHGLAVESGCRSGSCGACQTRLLSGVVRYADPPDHDVPKGHCLLCVGQPQSALVLEA